MMQSQRVTLPQRCRETSQANRPCPPPYGQGGVGVRGWGSGLGGLLYTIPTRTDPNTLSTLAHTKTHEPTTSRVLLNSTQIKKERRHAFSLSLLSYIPSATRRMIRHTRTFLTPINRNKIKLYRSILLIFWCEILLRECV